MPLLNPPTISPRTSYQSTPNFPPTQHTHTSTHQSTFIQRLPMKGTPINHLCITSQRSIILHSTDSPSLPTSTFDHAQSPPTDHTNMLSPFVLTSLPSFTSPDGQQSFILSINDNPLSVLTNVSSLDINVLKLNLEALKPQTVSSSSSSSSSSSFSSSSFSSTSAFPSSSSPFTTSSSLFSASSSSSFSPPSLFSSSLFSTASKASQSSATMTTATVFQFPSNTSPSTLEAPITSTTLPPASTASNTQPSSTEAGKDRLMLGACKVCGDVASGKYFGALVCVPCKTFFLRYAGEGLSFVCKGHQDCDISLSTRIQCKFCRFKKCLDAGMNRKVRPIQVEPKEGRQLCVVCSDIGNGVHFGAMTCEGCKKFFRRGLNEHKSYVCKYDKDCLINPQTRNACRFCRYNRCKRLGMSREAIQMGRPSKVLNQQQQQRQQQQQQQQQQRMPEGMDVTTTALDLTTTLRKPGHEDEHNNNNNNNNENSQNNITVYSNHINTHIQTNTPPHQVINGNTTTTTTNNNNNNNNNNNTQHTINKIHDNFINTSVNFSTFNGSLGADNVNDDVNDKAGNRESGVASRVDYEKHHIFESFRNLTKHTTAVSPTKTDHPSFFTTATQLLDNSSPFDSTSAATSLLENTFTFNETSKPNSESTHVSTPLSSTTHPFKTHPSTTQSPITHSVHPSTTSPLLHTSHAPPSSLQVTHADSTVSSTLIECNTPVHKPNRHFLANSQLLNTSTNPQQTPNKLQNPPKSLCPSHNNEKFKRFLAEGYRHQRNGDDEESKPRPSGPRKAARQSCSSPSISSSEDYCSTESDKAVIASSTQFLLQILEQKIMQSLQVSEKYWLAPFPRDDNLLFSDARHWDIINHIFPNYDHFVQMSEKINRSLNTEYENWRMEKEKSKEMSVELLSEWIKNKVIPAFTVVSVTYCKKVPGFSIFDTSDQVKIIKFGQSPSRMLAAVLHWFDPATKNFKHFLSWRDHVPGMNDRFKQSLIKFAMRMQQLQLDPIEAALLNSLIIVSTDYADLNNTKVIETLRCQIISTFRAYTTAKYGTPNDRLERLFQNIPELRKLGLLHNEMTNTRTMMAEEFGDRLLLLLNL